MNKIKPSVKSISSTTGLPVLQIDAKDCGIASLANILKHYGKDVSLAELRTASGDDGDHKRASGIVRAAQNYGLRAELTHCRVETLQEHPYLLPAIALWEGNHFVVVEQFTEDGVVLNDPRAGKKQITQESFRSSFSNFAILVTPRNNFQFISPKLPGNGPATDSLLRMIQESVRGEVNLFSEKFVDYQRDFGGILSKCPRLIVRATCEQDIIYVLQLAQATGTPVHFRGAGHSCQGQSLNEGGILLVNIADHVDYEVLEEGQISVTTRGRWHYLESELNQLGRSFPILTDNPITTIGGTLSVGGYGPRSIVYGAQVTQVEQLRLILPNGEAVWCSPSENDHLFRYSLAGLGQVGFVERVVMRTVPKLPQLIWYQAKYSSLPEMAEALQKMAFSVEQPDAFMAYQITGQGLYACYGFNKTPGVITITPLEANLQQASVKISQTPANLGHAYRQNWSPDAYCPAVDYFIDPDKLPIFLSFLNECLHDKLLVPYIHGLLILAVRRPPVDRLLPFEAASFGTTPLKFLVGFYPIIPIQDVTGLGRIRALLQETLALCIQLGGRPYLYGYHELDESTKHHLYGPHYAHLQSVRSQLDPHHLVNHGIF